MFEDSPTARAFFEYLKTPIAHEIWMSRQGMLTAHSGVNSAAYANDLLRSQGDVLLGATSFRFDASDLMPGAIGAGAFWTAMVNYVNGDSAQEVADFVQEAWDGLDQ